MYKWLSIMGIVCIGFIVVLLGLGYLLKENKITTTELKQKLEQENLLNNSNKNTSKAILTFVDNKQDNNDFVNKQKNIIVSHLTCTSANQCVIVNTKRSEFDCYVAINIIGASILTKTMNNRSQIEVKDTEACGVYSEQNFISECRSNLCQIVPEP